MPRRREVPKREVLPDPLYQSQLVTKFISSVMKCGKKSTAEGIFYGAMKQIEGKTQDDPLKTFKKALENVKPALEVKSRRVGGSTYQVPVEVRGQAAQELIRPRVTRPETPKRFEKSHAAPPRSPEA